ncbi:MAG: glycosyltransferase family 4 protein [Rhodobiaceae bacterium]|nr:glycosyltransferase family 4 protein [Rhodobiaceae bacterium]
MQGRTPRLVYLITEDWFFVSHFMNRARAAKAAGYDVQIVTRRSTGGVHDGRLSEFGLTEFEMSRNSLNPVGLAAEALRLRRIYRAMAPDIVHHVGLKAIIVGGLAAFGNRSLHVVNAPVGMGFIFTSPSLKMRLLRGPVRMLIGMMLRAPNAVTIVENSEDRAEFISRFGLDPTSTELIEGAGVDPDVYVDRPRDANPDRPPVVMLAARMLREKGVGEFVEAARLLKGRGLKAQFVLVGAPDPVNPGAIPEETLKAWQAEGIVSWAGHSNDMPAMLTWADIVCLPSYREGLPKVLLEAASAGCALVTTDVPGCRAIVAHEKTGLLVKPRDVASLADGLARMIEDPALRASLAQAGRERVLARFSDAVVNQKTLAVYRNLAGRL